MKSSQVVEDAQGDGQHQDHGEAGEDGPGDEVGREDRLVPARHVGDGEVGADDRVHRDDQRRRQPAEEEVGHLVAVPVPGRAAPAQRQDAVGDSGPGGCCARSRSVARSGIMPMYQKSSDTVK